jgi:hypothetical protein
MALEVTGTKKYFPGPKKAGAEKCRGRIKPEPKKVFQGEKKYSGAK